MRAESLRALLLGCVLLGLSCQRACGGQSPAVPLATVDGSPITEAQLQLALEETLGREAKSASPAARRKVLESLVATRAIAIVAQKELSAAELAEVEQQAAAYRDDRLVRLYLEKHEPPTPVTDAMVEAYYREHLDQFGGHAVRSYELLASEHEPKGAPRAALIAAFGKAEAEPDWSKLAKSLSAPGAGVRFESGQLPASSLDPEVTKVIEGLEPARASKPFFVRERIFVARLKSTHDKSARPLAEVAPMIQRTLRARQLKAAVERAGDKALQEAEIVHRSK